ncbi:hypothetical protein GWK47_003321 [Chionoecetes opilio]|uniref:C3H1-type domain-containing protein n=1 Tax=Chionoecetes opilio TaxID=41210 RepID=A0A8J5D5X0_CHIOP|nr:hypothetical protein GWK47_003321 [Chionoecetes opilio]
MAASREGQDSNTTQTNKCAACCINDDMKHTIQCGECKEWIHYYCSKLPLYNLMCLLKTNRKYTCEKCYVSKYLDEDWEKVAKEAQEAIENQESSRRSPTESNLSNLSEHQTSLQTHEDEETLEAAQPAGQSFDIGNTPEDMRLTLHRNNDLNSSPDVQDTSDRTNRQNLVGRGNIQENHATGHGQNNNKNSKPICRFYRKGICKYGSGGKDCNFRHPKPCKKLINHGLESKHGCKLGKDCQDYHPFLCRNSMQKGECFIEKCKYTHIRGTRRHRGHYDTHNQNSQYSTPQQQQVPAQHHHHHDSGTPSTATINQGDFLGAINQMKAAISDIAKVVEAQGLMMQKQTIGKHMNQLPQVNQIPMAAPVYPWLNAVIGHSA